MIRWLAAAVRFALVALGILVVLEVTLAVAATGGWLRFAAGVVVGCVALFMLPRALAELADDQAAR